MSVTAGRLHLDRIEQCRLDRVHLGRLGDRQRHGWLMHVGQTGRDPADGHVAIAGRTLIFTQTERRATYSAAALSNTASVSCLGASGNFTLTTVSGCTSSSCRQYLLDHLDSRRSGIDITSE